MRSALEATAVFRPACRHALTSSTAPACMHAMPFHDVACLLLHARMQGMQVRMQQTARSAAGPTWKANACIGVCHFREVYAVIDFLQRVDVLDDNAVLACDAAQEVCLAHAGERGKLVRVHCHAVLLLQGLRAHPACMHFIEIVACICRSQQ